MRYNHLDVTYDPNLRFADGESLSAANYPPGGVTYEDEAYIGAGMTEPYMENSNPALDKAKNAGTKVIHLHLTQDGAIRWRHSVEYYRQVARYFDKRADGQPRDFASLQQWYRFYMMPGVGHCNAPSPVPDRGSRPLWSE
jgi:tannase